MVELMKVVETYQNEIIFGMLIAFAVVLVVGLVILGQYSSLKKKNRELKDILTISEGENIEKLLINTMAYTRESKKETAELTSQIEELRAIVSKTYKKMGVVRYNAFEKAGSDLSFSVAILNDSLSGVVITSIYSRGNCTVYAKEIINGKSEHNFSEEEIKAVEKAVAQ